MPFDTSGFRHTEYPVDPLFTNRWSPRAMSGEPLNRDALMRLFEAARWAPSSYNNQPWRFIYAFRNTSDWDRMFDLLTPGNRTWADKAAVLLLIAGKQTLDSGKPSVTHALDTGAAWENLALQGALDGLVVHGMEGFDYVRARQVLEVPDEFDILAMAAIGHPGSAEALPDPLREREFPSGRKPLAEIAFEGRFPQPTP